MRPIEYTNIIKPSVDYLERCGTLLLDSHGMAAFLGMPVKKVAELRCSGRLPLPCRLGKCLRWSVLELLRWIQDGCPRLDNWTTMRNSARWYWW
jgi:hypothetical protein